MDKIWYAFIEGIQQGPFSPAELRSNRNVTPDTPVRKQGSSEWLAIRYIPELKDIFKDNPEFDAPDEDLPKPGYNIFPEQEDPEALVLQRDPLQFFLWLLIILLISLYIIFQIFRNF